MISFDNLNTNLANSIDKVTFPRLESLTLRYFDRFKNEWMSFFRNHNYLQNLTFTSVESQDFVEITADLTELVELKVETMNYFNAELIKSILDSHKKLQYLEIKRNQEEDLTTLIELCGNEWTAHQTNTNGRVTIVMERIKNN